MPQPPSMPELLGLRTELDQVDRALIEAMARRQALVAEIGQVKLRNGGQLRDFRREREVLEKVRSRALEIGLEPKLAENVLKQLIEASLTTQEQDRVRWSAAGQGRRAMVIGGSGRMGAWMVRLLADQGFDVEIADPVRPPFDLPWREDWRQGGLEQDLIVVAAPLRATAEILTELAQRRPPGLLFDIGSLKTPLAEPLRQGAAQGLPWCSVHPMFGPDTQLLSGRHVIFVDLGHAGAVAAARALFASTSADLVEMSLDEHDRAIAYVLGLSHALNIAFAEALARSGTAAPRLAELSSTTFSRQLAITAQVAQENPHLYYEIQALNAHSALASLEAALKDLREAVSSGDERAFVAMMARGRAYFEARPDQPLVAPAAAE